MSPKEPQNSIKTAIWLPIETHDALKKESKRLGLSLSGCARMILMNHTGVWGTGERRVTSPEGYTYITKPTIKE